jgi:DNA-binding Xre family transcriptional regulator
MINPETINLSVLPYLSIEQRKDLPSVSGIYFAIDSLGNIQYIGRSFNIRQRWLSHHRTKELVAICGVKIIWLEISEVSLLPEIETALIEWFNPPLNGVQHGYGTTKQPRLPALTTLLNRSVWKLRQIMADKKLSNEEVASRMRERTGRKTFWTTISRWKQLDVMPKIDGTDLDALVAALECKRDDLLGGSDRNA